MNLKQLTELWDHAWWAVHPAGTRHEAAILAIWKVACEAQREKDAAICRVLGSIGSNACEAAIRNASLAELDKESTR